MVKVTLDLQQVRTKPSIRPNSGFLFPLKLPHTFHKAQQVINDHTEVHGSSRETGLRSKERHRNTLKALFALKEKCAAEAVDVSGEEKREKGSK
jgi:hypothetical protein